MNYVTRRFLRCAMVVFSWFVVPYSRVTTLWVPRKKLPPMKNPLLQIKAVKLAHMIRMRQVTSEAVVEAYIERCREVNPLVNAIVEDRFELAIEEAREIDGRIASGEKTYEEMERETPLLGLPVTVKESIAVKGMINQGGRVFKHKRVAVQDAPCVQLVKKHGGIILLVSNTPELCMCWETYNNVSGQTRNPYDLTRTPGGSSGGEAALISSGASLIGLSSDIAGSARLPAMFTGIYGHKPTPYAISPKGHIPASNVEYWGDFFTIAPMTRYASDLSLLLRCVNDPDGRQLQLDKPTNVKDIKFFFMNNDGPSGTTRRLSKDIKCTIEDVASHFNANKVKINGLKWALEISMSAMLRIKNVETIYYDTEDGEPKKHMGTETLKYASAARRSPLDRRFDSNDSRFSFQIFSRNVRQHLPVSISWPVAASNAFASRIAPPQAGKHRGQSEAAVRRSAGK